MVEMIKPGSRVVRGKDWESGNEDGNGPGTVIIEYPDDCWVVDWDNNPDLFNCYWMVDGTYELKVIDENPVKLAAEKTLVNKLFLAKEFMDMKIICNGKIFECHKSVLSCQSDVFKAMFLNKDTTESKSGEITFNDFPIETMETFLNYLYHEEVQEKLINTYLLFIADKYNVDSLVKVCKDHLKSDLSTENCLDILFAAHVIPKQEDLFHAASDFVNQNKGKIMKTPAWKKTMETNSKLIAEILSNVLDLQ